MDVALGCLLLRKTSSTPAVVPGAAPALAKAGVGGYIAVPYYVRFYWCNIFCTFTYSTRLVNWRCFLFPLYPHYIPSISPLNHNFITRKWFVPPIHHYITMLYWCHFMGQNDAHMYPKNGLFYTRNRHSTRCGPLNLKKMIHPHVDARGIICRRLNFSGEWSML